MLLTALHHHCLKLLKNVLQQDLMFANGFQVLLELNHISILFSDQREYYSHLICVFACVDFELVSHFNQKCVLVGNCILLSLRA